MQKLLAAILLTSSCAGSSKLDTASNRTTISTFSTYCKLYGGMPSPIFDNNSTTPTSTCSQSDEFWLSDTGAARHLVQCRDVISDESWQASDEVLNSIRSALENSDLMTSEASYRCTSACGADQRAAQTHFTISNESKDIAFPDGIDVAPSQLKPAIEQACSLTKGQQ